MMIGLSKFVIDNALLSLLHDMEWLIYPTSEFAGKDLARRLADLEARLTL